MQLKLKIDCVTPSMLKNPSCKRFERTTRKGLIEILTNLAGKCKNEDVSRLRLVDESGSEWSSSTDLVWPKDLPERESDDAPYKFRLRDQDLLIEEPESAAAAPSVEGPAASRYCKVSGWKHSMLEERELARRSRVAVELGEDRARPDAVGDSANGAGRVSTDSTDGAGGGGGRQVLGEKKKTLYVCTGCGWKGPARDGVIIRCPDDGKIDKKRSTNCHRARKEGCKFEPCGVPYLQGEDTKKIAKAYLARHAEEGCAKGMPPKGGRAPEYDPPAGWPKDVAAIKVVIPEGKQPGDTFEHLNSTGRQMLSLTVPEGAQAGDVCWAEGSRPRTQKEQQKREQKLQKRERKRQKREAELEAELAAREEEVAAAEERRDAADAEKQAAAQRGAQRAAQERAELKRLVAEIEQRGDGGDDGASGGACAQDGSPSGSDAGADVAPAGDGIQPFAIGGDDDDDDDDEAAPTAAAAPAADAAPADEAAPATVTVQTPPVANDEQAEGAATSSEAPSASTAVAGPSASPGGSAALAAAPNAPAVAHPTGALALSTQRKARIAAATSRPGKFKQVAMEMTGEHGGLVASFAMSKETARPLKNKAREAYVRRAKLLNRSTNWQAHGEIPEGLHLITLRGSGIGSRDAPDFWLIVGVALMLMAMSGGKQSLDIVMVEDANPKKGGAIEPSLSGDFRRQKAVLVTDVGARFIEQVAQTLTFEQADRYRRVAKTTHTPNSVAATHEFLSDLHELGIRSFAAAGIDVPDPRQLSHPQLQSRLETGNLFYEVTKGGGTEQDEVVRLIHDILRAAASGGFGVAELVRGLRTALITTGLQQANSLELEGPQREGDAGSEVESTLAGGDD